MKGRISHFFNIVSKSGRGFSRKVAGLTLAVGLCGGLAATVFGQTYTGTVAGRVLDQQNAVLAGAKVTLISDGTGLKRETVTNETGVFSFTIVAAGLYSLQAEQANFKP